MGADARLAAMNLPMPPAPKPMAVYLTLKMHLGLEIEDRASRKAREGCSLPGLAECMVEVPSPRSMDHSLNRESHPCAILVK